jgi:hypothetical protein
MTPVIALVGDRRAESSVAVTTAFLFPSSPLKKKDIALAKRHIYIINLHPILTMIMERQQVSKRLVFSSPVMRLMAQEGFM